MPIPVSKLEIKRTYSVVVLLVGVSGPAPAGMIDKQGMAPWEICGLCHGLDGNSVMAKFPKLAGQKPAYIAKQFWDFKGHNRNNDGGQMQAITEEVAKQDVAIIAEYFSQQPAPKPSAPERFDASLVAQGKRLFEQGRKNLPACVDCHNKQQSAIPWLDAQHQDYLRKQLKDFREGERSNDPEQVMTSVAKALTEPEIEAVTLYLSQHQLRPNSHDPVTR